MNLAPATWLRRLARLLSRDGKGRRSHPLAHPGPHEIRAQVAAGPIEFASARERRHDLAADAQAEAEWEHGRA